MLSFVRGIPTNIRHAASLTRVHRPAQSSVLDLALRIRMLRKSSTNTNFRLEGGETYLVHFTMMSVSEYVYDRPNDSESYEYAGGRKATGSATHARQVKL
jgi:hypothetical protein